MKRYLIILAAMLSVAGCAAGYTRAEYVYAEPEEHVYVVPVDRVVVVRGLREERERERG